MIVLSKANTFFSASLSMNDATRCGDAMYSTVQYRKAKNVAFVGMHEIMQKAYNPPMAQFDRSRKQKEVQSLELTLDDDHDASSVLGGPPSRRASDSERQPQQLSSGAAMVSVFSKLNPLPGFPEYSGPHKVGTIDVEIAVSELESPSPAPDDSIPTVQYRIFYPCEESAKKKPIYWLPRPQREYVSAYMRFAGANSILAQLISFFPNLLNFVTIPARKNAALLNSSDSSSTRLPVMIFSHGLGGTRNTYSHLAGSVASHGVIVVCPEHRDGSAPVSIIRDVASGTPCSEKEQKPRKPRRVVNYVRYSHTPSPEVEEGRNSQLKIRLWELGLIHDSLLKIDKGDDITNLNTSSSPLSAFENRMEVQEPGKIIFAGHSFGAATMTQLVKFTYHSPQISEAPADFETLFTPSSRSSIVKQVTPQTPLILLDVWCLPLRSSTSRWLWEKPLPCYASGGAGGAALLTVESQAFYKWQVNLKSTKQLLSPDPTAESFDYAAKGIPEPNLYYAASSAHLSQSDFGLLFPFVTKKFLAALEPDRVMRLNVRAIMQLLRSNKVPVAATSAADMEMGGDEHKGVTNDDHLIFNRNNEVRSWRWISTDCNDPRDLNESGMTAELEKAQVAEAPVEDQLGQPAEPGDAVVQNEAEAV
ncbi:hypothetical protein B7463_g10461, partial [Scytalidium lignicola]